MLCWRADVEQVAKESTIDMLGIHKLIEIHFHSFQYTWFKIVIQKLFHNFHLFLQTASGGQGKGQGEHPLQPVISAHC